MSRGFASRLFDEKPIVNRFLLGMVATLAFSVALATGCEREDSSSDQGHSHEHAGEHGEGGTHAHGEDESHEQGHADKHEEDDSHADDHDDEASKSEGHEQDGPDKEEGESHGHDHVQEEGNDESHGHDHAQEEGDDESHGHDHAQEEGNDESHGHNHAEENANDESHGHDHAQEEGDNDESHEHEGGSEEGHGHDQSDQPESSDGDEHGDSHDAGAHRGHGGGTEGTRFSKEQQNRVEFSTAPAERRMLRETVPAEGYVRAAPDADARVTTPVDGRVMAVGDRLPDLGERIEVGDPVLRVAPTVETNVLPTLRAKLSTAKTRLERREREVERLRELAEEGAIPRTRLLDAESKRDRAATRADAAEQHLRRARSYKSGGSASTLTIRAPISGKVVERSVAPGENKVSGERLLRLVDSDRLRVEARLAEANIDELEGKMTGLSFALEDSDRRAQLRRSEGAWIGHVDIVDPSTRTTSFWFRVPDRLHEYLRVGQYKRVQLESEPDETERLTVPGSALLEEKGLSILYVALGDETFERRLVETGRQSGRWVEITEGLEAGERVVTRGAYYVKLAATSSDTPGGHTH